MKIRTDFVTNSSSSGFVVVNVQSVILSQLFKEYGLKMDFLKEYGESYGEENGIPEEITDSVALTVCGLLERMIGDGDFDDCNGINEDSMNQLIERIKESKASIDAEADADIESGCAQSDAGGPYFEYAHLQVKSGKGTFVAYSANDEYYGDDNNPTPLYQWAKDHGYYDPANERPGFEGGYAEAFYFFPPYKELALSYPAARRVEVDGSAIISKKCVGLTFVITGKVNVFKNRDAFIAYVESQGGKVSGSVSKNTNYLVNNDFDSTSSKNKKARELGIPIISEDEFVDRFGCP